MEQVTELLEKSGNELNREDIVNIIHALNRQIDSLTLYDNGIFIKDLSSKAQEYRVAKTKCIALLHMPNEAAEEHQSRIEHEQDFHEKLKD